MTKTFFLVFAPGFVGKNRDPLHARSSRTPPDEERAPRAKIVSLTEATCPDEDLFFWSSAPNLRKKKLVTLLWRRA